MISFLNYIIFKSLVMLNPIIANQST